MLPALPISTIKVRVKTESLKWILCKKLQWVFQLKDYLLFKKAYSGFPGWLLSSQVLPCKFRASIFIGTQLVILSLSWATEKRTKAKLANIQDKKPNYVQESSMNKVWEEKEGRIESPHNRENRHAKLRGKKKTSNGQHYTQIFSAISFSVKPHHLSH